MVNKVGKQKLPVTTCKQTKDTVDGIRLELGPYGVELTPDEKKRRMRLRAGSEEVIEILCLVAEENGIFLPTTVRHIRDDLAFLEQLRPLERACEALLGLVEDTASQAEHEVWSATTAYYTALHRLAGVEPAIEAELREIVEFFAQSKDDSNDGKEG
jgi:hypothetical protein